MQSPDERPVPAEEGRLVDAPPTILAAPNALPSDPSGGPTREAPPPPPRGERFGRYLLVEKLGQGAMGVVWKAWDTTLERTVCLKFIREEQAGGPAALERFLREARLAARLRHPHILPVHDVGEEDGRHYLAMDYVEGRSLGAFLDERRASKREGHRDGHARLRDEVRMLADVADAAACAHQHGVVHRDLKPANILLDKEDNAYVIDFGLAKENSLAQEDRSRLGSLTISGQLLGTPAYMSPEQAEGRTSEVGPSSDLHALGVVLYETLTGRLPFEGLGVVDLLRKVIEDEPVPPRRWNLHVPSELEAVCLKALEKERVRRYPTAGEFAEELRRWLRGEPVHVRRPSLPSRAWRWLARRKRATIPVAAGLALVAGLVLWGLHASSSRQATLHAISDTIANSVDRFGDTVRRVEMSQAARGTLARQPLDLLDELARQRPDFGPAYSWRGRVKDLLGDEKGAREDYDRGCALSPDWAIVWFLRGTSSIERYASSRELPSTITSATGVEFGPSPPETEKQRSWREDGLEDLKRMRAAAESDPQVGEERARLGRAFAALYGGGRPAYQATLRLLEGTGGPRANRLRAVALYYLKRFEEAAEAYSLTLQEWPQDADARSGLAMARHASALVDAARGEDVRDRYRSAIAEWDRVLGVGATRTIDYNNRGRVYGDLGDAEAARGVDPRESIGRAIADYDCALQRDPDYTEAYHNRGNAYRSLGSAEEARGLDPREDFRKAIADYAQALRVNPEFADAYNGRGIAYHVLGEAEAARRLDPRESYARSIADHGEALRRDPDSAATYLNRGGTYTDLGEAEAARGMDPRESYRKAMADYEQALQRNPNLAGAYINRGCACADLGEAEAARGQDPRESYCRAMADYEQALQRNPGFVEAYNDRGWAFVRLGDAEEARGTDPRESYRKAIADFDRTLQRKSDYRQAYVNRGNAYLELGQSEEKRGADPRESYGKAIADYGQAVQRNPEDPVTYNNRGDVYRLLGSAEEDQGVDPRESYGRALADYDQSLRRDPDNANTCKNRGNAFYYLAKADQARGVDPREGYRKAIADLDRAIQRDPETESAFFCRGDAYFALGRAEKERGLDPRQSFERAEADYKMDAERKDAYAHRMLGRLYRAMGRYDEAIAALETYILEAPDRAEKLRAEIEEIRQEQRDASKARR